jgi:Na+/H+ antiporter NhaC
MSPQRRSAHGREARIWELLSLEHLMTRSVVHIVYWSGLGLVVLLGFLFVGGAVGVALREGQIMGWLLAIPVLVAGLLMTLIMAILWRSFCEFYVVIFRISDDLRALREGYEAEAGAPAGAQQAHPGFQR